MYRMSATLLAASIFGHIYLLSPPAIFLYFCYLFLFI
jgi:hypothetical protein